MPLYLIVTLALSVKCDPYPCNGIDCGIDLSWRNAARVSCNNAKPEGEPIVRFTLIEEDAEKALESGAKVYSVFSWKGKPHVLEITRVHEDRYYIMKGSGTRIEGAQ